MKKHSRLVLMLAASTMLAACQTTSSHQTDAQERSSRIDSVLERAAGSAASRGEKGSSALINEKVYKRNSGDAHSALQYAKSLRETDYLNRAALVLAPFAQEENAAPGVKTEYAAIQLALGRYDAAEEFAQQAIVQDSADYKAYHFLGIALDAKGQHEEAERAFRIGLDNWGNEDPTPIMNNLALNLASQSYLDEAVEILEKALAVSPNRQEVERNLRIVQALKLSGGHPKHRTPKPEKKPFAAASSLNLEPQMEQPPAAAPVEDVAAEKVDAKAKDEAKPAAKSEPKAEKQSSAESTKKTAPVVKVEAENTKLEAKNEPIVIGPQKK